MLSRASPYLLIFRKVALDKQRQSLENQYQDTFLPYKQVYFHSSFLYSIQQVLNRSLDQYNIASCSYVNIISP